MKFFQKTLDKLKKSAIMELARGIPEAYSQ